ncbi:phage tail assembly chaperone [Desulfovibrio desulfuricans]|uniref:phage tail assembly chaperone n=1 Tax=Desulfovibrio desulfuricans TaxID=876 RepID=UPI0039843D50
MFDISQVDMSLAPRAYCYDNDGIFTHSERFSIDPLESEMAGKPVWLQPGMSLLVAPGDKRKGYAQQVDGDRWKEVEDHRGKEGFVNGQPHEIKAYGPLPDGWSDTPPPLTTEELFFRIRGQRDARINSVLWMRERHSDELALGKETSLSQEQYTALLTYIQALRDLPAQPGAPWDGGDIPWPVMPQI